jgi:hypothetical protein
MWKLRNTRDFWGDDTPLIQPLTAWVPSEASPNNGGYYYFKIFRCPSCNAGPKLKQLRIRSLSLSSGMSTTMVKPPTFWSTGLRTAGNLRPSPSTLEENHDHLTLFPSRAAQDDGLHPTWPPHPRSPHESRGTDNG